MPRFYFDLASRDKHIPDNAGKELETLRDADEHARKLIDKILFHLGDDDAAEWKVVISNNDHDAQMIVPFPASAMFRRQTEEQTIIGSGFVRVIGANSAVFHIRSQPRRTILGRAECWSPIAPAGLRILRRGVAD